MIVLGIVLPIIGLLAKITVAWTIRPIALVVGLLLILWAQSVIRPVAAAITDNALQRLRRPWRVRSLYRSRLRNHRPGPTVLQDPRMPLGWNG
jgi:hypothetical protein